MKHGNALAYLRQLCCLGLEKDIVLPEFLRVVSAAVPSEFNGFTETDARLMPVRLHIGYDIPGFAEVFVETGLGYWTNDILMRGAHWFSTHAALTDFKLLDEHFYDSDFYNLMFRGFDMPHYVQTPVMHNGRPLGVLSLTRPASGRSFSANEQALCARLTPYLAHAVQTLPTENMTYEQNGASGMLVMDSKGTIHYASRQAERLLHLARAPWTFDFVDHEDPLAVKLTQLCRDLSTIFQGRCAVPPSWTLTNGSGRFQFRADWLEGKNEVERRLIGLTITHQEPLPLQLLRALRELPLSPMQKEVALLLAQGIAPENIGRRLHIKTTTVNDHIRKIYGKLDIHRREELVRMLQVQEDPTESI